MNISVCGQKIKDEMKWSNEKLRRIKYSNQLKEDGFVNSDLQIKILRANKVSNNHSQVKNTIKEGDYEFSDPNTIIVQYDPNKQAKIEYSSMRKRLEREK